ncbi:MAG: hypothetical protein ACE5FY_07640 [Nitrospiria bacterium]
MKRLFLLGVFSIVLILGPRELVWARSTEFLRIPTTFSGLSGLLLTQSIDTLASGRLEIGMGLSHESSDKPDFQLTQLSPTLTYGTGSNVEVSAQFPLFIQAEQKGNSGSDTGDLNASLKWRFLEPNPALTFPGFALSASVFFPTGSPQKGAGAVDSWAIKAILVSSAEAAISFTSEPVIIGFYANGGLYIQDLGDATEEKHSIIDLGVLIPVIDSRQLQFMLEGNFRFGREALLGNDYTGITAGLRYITRHVALNAGVQHRLNEDPFDDTDQILLYWSYFF